MDEEESFANLLSQTTTLTKPAWSAPADDPWANPFAQSSPSASTAVAGNPFADVSSPYGAASTTLDAGFGGADTTSPYVQQLEEDDRMGRGVLPDPPSVIAAREQEYAAATQKGFSSPPQTPFDSGYPSAVPEPAVQSPQTSPVKPVQPPTRKLPSDLIDEDLMAASDPSISLKKAFVKSTPAPATTASSATKPTQVQATPEKPKAYVFKPGKKDVSASPKKKAIEVAPAESHEVKKEESAKPEIKEEKKEENDEALANGNGDAKAKDVPQEIASKTPDVPPEPVITAATPSKEEPNKFERAPHPASIPLPDSIAATPDISRSATPAAPGALDEVDVPVSATSVQTPIDRVAVSPLDAPTVAESEYGFKNLSIGGSSAPSTANPVAIPPVVPEKPQEDWSVPSTAAARAVSPPSSGSRFGGKGWGAMDDDEGDNGGLFGRGGPSLPVLRAPSVSDGWGGAQGGWEDSLPTSSSGPSYASEARRSPSPPPAEEPEDTSTHNGGPNGFSAGKRAHPVFTITVSDPTKVGDPVRGYTVYTIRVRTTSPHYRRNEFSALRRFSDFLWLFDTLTTNNPGIIIPPMPDKKSIGRFQDQFIETRRAALQKCLAKIANHPVLQLDPDLRMFLESDNFALDVKNRKSTNPNIQDTATLQGGGLLSSWTGPKYFEQDDWFDSRKTFLENLENQLRSLSKSVEHASKTRLELAISMGDFAETISALAESDLGSNMCGALAGLADLMRKEKEQNEELAKSDVIHILNMADEYVRFIGSVRLAFAGRIKTYHQWQANEKEVIRLRNAREKLRQQGKLGDRVQSSLAEVVEAERRARDASAEFETVSKLVKSEFARFERERVDEFKQTLQNHLDGQIQAQKELISQWEEYHGLVLKMVQRNQGGKSGSSSG